LKAQQKPGTRRERALATRRRILRAASAQFHESGYAATTMAAIAKRAGVAVQTLYFTFHTKAALLEETVHASVVGFDNWAPVAGGIPAPEMASPKFLRQFHPWFAAFDDEPTARGALAIFLDETLEIMKRTAPLVYVISESARHPDAKDLHTEGETRRIVAYRFVIHELAKKPPGLRRGLTERRAADVLFAVCSGETYQMLRGQGWTPKQIRAWWQDLLGQHLLSEA